MVDAVSILYPDPEPDPPAKSDEPVDVLYRNEERKPGPDDFGYPEAEKARADRLAAEKAEADKGKPEGDPLEGLEGIDPADPFTEPFREAVTELGLDKEGAGKLVQLQQRHAAAYWEKTSTEWADAAAKEFSQADFTAARDLVSRFGDDELRGLMAGPYGNHPAIIRLLARLGQRVAG